MSSAVIVDVLGTMMADKKLRAVFEEAMRHAGKTGWSVARAMSGGQETNTRQIEEALQILQEKKVLRGSGGTGLNAYYSATPLAFELKEKLHR